MLRSMPEAAHAFGVPQVNEQTAITAHFIVK